jgi:hypothetical protein
VLTLLQTLNLQGGPPPFHFRSLTLTISADIIRHFHQVGLCNATTVTSDVVAIQQFDRRILCTVIWICSFLKGCCTHDYLGPRLTAIPHCNSTCSRGKRAVSQSSTSLLKIYFNIFRSIWLQSHMAATSAGSNDAGCTMSDIPPPLSMIPGTSQSYPELRHNDTGNTYARNNYGTWEPHPGVCQVN